MTIVDLGKTEAGRFCWLDLAATDAASARAFYGQLFGWKSHEQSANAGLFTHLQLADQDIGSLYQMNNRLMDQGLCSHWTPYVRAHDVDDVAQRTNSFGGKVIVRPFVVSGIARIALILDSVGAQVGLWEPIQTALGAGN